jgi:hypothetical protein
MSIDEEVTSRTDPAISTVWWNILSLLWDIDRSSLQCSFFCSSAGTSVLCFSMWYLICGNDARVGRRHDPAGNNCTIKSSLPPAWQEGDLESQQSKYIM